MDRLRQLLATLPVGSPLAEQLRQQLGPDAPVQAAPEPETEAAWLTATWPERRIVLDELRLERPPVYRRRQSAEDAPDMGEGLTCQCCGRTFRGEDWQLLAAGGGRYEFWCAGRWLATCKPKREVTD